jgi:hypothetical protein
MKPISVLAQRSNRHFATESKQISIFRGVGTGGGHGGSGPPNQVLPSALFPGAKCPFLAWKMSLRLHCLAKEHFWKLEFMLFPEIFFHFPEKYHISRKFFGISGILFWDDPPPRRQHFRGKFFRCPFLFEKCPSKPGPPNF